MKLLGSATIGVECLSCLKHSPKFRVYFFDEDGEKVWEPLKMPSGWEIEEDESFCESGDEVNGYCPNHKRE